MLFFMIMLALIAIVSNSVHNSGKSGYVEQFIETVEIYFRMAAGRDVVSGTDEGANSTVYNTLLFLWSLLSLYFISLYGAELTSALTLSEGWSLPFSVGLGGCDVPGSPICNRICKTFTPTATLSAKSTAAGNWRVWKSCEIIF